jgi:hypothetical protein
MAVAGVQPIGVTKKNTWNPNPSWRTDAGWPAAVRPAELQPITIEKIPSNIVESFPLSAREKSLPPVTGDAIKEKAELVGNSQQAQLQESANAKIIPWNTFVEEPSSAAARNRTAPAMGAPTSLGRMVSSEQTVQAESFDPNSSSRPTPVATETSSESKSMSPVDAQRFIRQPKTRR